MVVCLVMIVVGLMLVIGGGTKFGQLVSQINKPKDN